VTSNDIEVKQRFEFYMTVDATGINIFDPGSLTEYSR